MCLSPQPANPRRQLAYRGRTPGTSRTKATCGRLDRGSTERNSSWDRGAATSRACSQSSRCFSVSGRFALVSKTAGEQRAGLLRHPVAKRGIQRRIHAPSRPDSLSSIHEGTARKIFVRVSGCAAMKKFARGEPVEPCRLYLTIQTMRNRNPTMFVIARKTTRQFFGVWRSPRYRRSGMECRNPGLHGCLRRRPCGPGCRPSMPA